MQADRITIIVRSVGERTEEKCIEWLKCQFDTDDICIIRNITPFSEALRKTFEIAIEKNKMWTLVVDADMFFDQKRLICFFDVAEKLINKDKNLLCIIPYMYDNFMQYSRQLGHLYCTRNMRKGLQYIQNETKRPETFMLNQMDSIGYLTYKADIVVGIHDFFQSYRDIVAKGIMHCSKHSNIRELRQLWENNKTEFKDFDWILKGCEIADNIDLANISADSKVIREIIDSYISKFPEQQNISDQEIEKALNKYINEIVYEKVIFHKKTAFKDYLISFLWSIKITGYLKKIKKKVVG